MGLKSIIEESAPFAIRLLWVCFIAGPTFWLVVSALKVLGFDNTVIAYWVQAVGSIGAIVGVFVVANWQMRKQQLLREEQERNRLLAMYAVVRSAAKHALSLDQFAKERPEDNVFRAFWSDGLSGTFHAALQALNAIPVHEFGRAELVIQCLSMIGAMSKLQVTVDHYMSLNSNVLLDRTYTNVMSQAKMAKYSWDKFAEHAGIGDVSLDDA